MIYYVTGYRDNTPLKTWVTYSYFTSEDLICDLVNQGYYNVAVSEIASVVK